MISSGSSGGHNTAMGVAQPQPFFGADKQESASSWRLYAPGYPILVILATLAAALLRFHGLTNRGLWIDEAFSADLSHRSFFHLLQSFRELSTNMALYHVLLHFWMKLGDSEYVMRSMSVLFSAATVPFIYALGSRLFGRNVGLIAAWLLAINAFHIHYAQEARAYALVVFLATVSTYLLVRNLQEPASASWRLYGILLAVMICSHILSLLVVVAHGAAILCLPARTIPWKGLARSAAWFVCLSVPMAVLVLMVKADPLNWVPKTDASVVLVYLVLTAGNRGTLLLALDAIAVALLILVAGRSAWRHGRTRENWGYLLVLFWFFLPFAIALSISIVRPMFVPRYLLFCLPAFLLAVSVGLARIRPRSVALTLGGAISLLGLAAIPPGYALSFGLEDWRTVSSYVFDQAEPGDGIFLYPDYVSIPFQYYRDHKKPAPDWPTPIAPVTGALASPSPATNLAGNSHETQLPMHRFWIVFHHAVPLTSEARKDLTANLTLWQSKGWRLTQAREFPAVSVLLFVVTSPEVVSPADLPNFLHPDATPGHAPQLMQ
jgi:mannosyltransferase